MPSPACVAEVVRLCQAARLGNAPATPMDTSAVMELWLGILGDMADAELRAASVAHLRDPERGRFWPTVADLRARVRSVISDTADPAEATWETIRARIAAGVYTMADALGPREMAALHAIGGTWALRRAEDGRELGVLRKRFLHLCRRETPALGVEERPQLSEPVDLLAAAPTGAREKLGRLLGPSQEDPDRAAARQRAIDRARAEADGGGEP
jgi:hypothetical protein